LKNTEIENLKGYFKKLENETKMLTEIPCDKFERKTKIHTQNTLIYNENYKKNRDIKNIEKSCSSLNENCISEVEKSFQYIQHSEYTDKKMLKCKIDEILNSKKMELEQNLTQLKRKKEIEFQKLESEKNCLQEKLKVLFYLNRKSKNSI
jgi:hypothetical protein